MRRSLSPRVECLGLMLLALLLVGARNRTAPRITRSD